MYVICLCTFYIYGNEEGGVKIVDFFHAVVLHPYSTLRLDIYDSLVSLSVSPSL